MKRRMALMGLLGPAVMLMSCGIFGSGGEIGTVEVGKAADLVVVELEDWSLLPGGDPASRIVFGGSAQMVRHVLVAGRPLVVDGALVAADPVALKERVGDAWEATRRRMEERA